MKLRGAETREDDYAQAKRINSAAMALNAELKEAYKMGLQCKVIIGIEEPRHEYNPEIEWPRPEVEVSIKRTVW